MRVGDLRIDPVVDGGFMVPPRSMFPNTTEESWAPHRRFLNEQGQLWLDIGGFLVRSRDRVALVDVGVGFVERVPEFGGKLLDSLAAFGCQPGDVTDVLFTHLHFDHIGWASVGGRAVFGNATYRCHSKDWDHFVTNNATQPGRTESLGLPTTADAWLAPVGDRIEMWDGDGAVFPGIDVRDAPGHSPGSTIVVVSSGAERALLLGDAVHCPAELLEPEWEMIADVDRELARRTREALAREFEGTDVPLAAPHFPDMQFGRLLRANGKLSWVFDQNI